MSIFFKTKLERELSEKKSQLKDLKKRRDQVQDVIDKLSTAFSDNVDEINNKLTSTINSMSAGVIGVPKAESVKSELYQKKEKYSDGNLNETKDQLVAERRAINDKILELETEIRRLETRIANGEEE